VAPPIRGSDSDRRTNLDLDGYRFCASYSGSSHVGYFHPSPEQHHNACHPGLGYGDTARRSVADSDRNAHSFGDNDSDSGDTHGHLGAGTHSHVDPYTHVY
jgi:hypothetical protein